MAEKGSVAQALALKEDGNRCFQKGDFAGAEGLYSKAIIVDPSNAALYTNRAMARLKLSLWDSVVADCSTCLSITPDSLKGHYYLALAQRALGAFDDALQHALRAHQLCVATDDKSLPAITTLVLTAKKQQWEARERRRIKEHSALESEMVAMLRAERDDCLKDTMDGTGEREELLEECDAKIAQLRAVFERARNDDDRKREVPDWAIDDISFGFMVDPVITPSGKSYERASLMEHLRKSQTDPLTRESLKPADVRPNLALRQACEEFLAQNGWAADW